MGILLKERAIRMTQNEYDVVLLKCVDGDTVDVDIDLGFGIWLKDERVRIMGIDTPESRTSDKVEKLFGTAAKNRLKELLKDGGKLITTEDKSGEDMKGKFGRILGDFRAPDGRLVTDILIEEGHCVAYFGGSKEEIQTKHMANRMKLLREGIVDQAEYDEAVALMEGK
jgi:micrococcal nuclease